MTESKVKLSRRNFLGTTTVGVAGAMLDASTRSALGAVQGANARINVGVIGVGARALELIRQLVTLEAAKITAMCEIFEPNLSKGIKLVGSQPKPFTDYRKLLDDKDVNAVVIATPLHLHAEMMTAALDAGKHVFVEKTMAYSVKQCDHMVRAAKEHPSLVVQVGLQRHYSPTVRRAAELCRTGALGKITHIQCYWHRNASWRRPVPTSNFDPRPWGYPDLEHLINWRMYKRYSQGLMAELGSHMMEIVNLIYGSMPVAVTGFGGIDYWKDGRETYDNVVVIYTFPGGRKATFSSITTNARHGEQLQILGTEASMDLGWNQATLFREKETPELIKTGNQTVITAMGETMKMAKSDQKGAKVEAGTKGKVDPTYLALASFLSSIRDGKKPEVDVQVGREAAATILLANEAMEEGRVVKF